MCPSTLGTRLRESGPSLECADKKSAGAFQRRQIRLGSAGFDEFLTRKGRQADVVNQLVAIVTQAFEEIYHFAIEVIVRFHGRRWPVDQHGGGTSEGIAKMREVCR